MPEIMRRVNRAVTNPLMRPLAGLAPPLAVAHHTGRKSGREYRTPVLAVRAKGGYVTPLPYGTDVDWCRNVLAAGRFQLQVFGRRVELANPRVVDADTALPLLPLPLRPGLRLLALPGYLVADRASAERRARRRPA